LEFSGFAADTTRSVFNLVESGSMTEA